MHVRGRTAGGRTACLGGRPGVVEQRRGDGGTKRQQRDMQTRTWEGSSATKLFMWFEYVTLTLSRSRLNSCRSCSRMPLLPSCWGPPPPR